MTVPRGLVLSLCLVIGVAAGPAALRAAGPLPAAATAELPDLDDVPGEDWAAFLGPTGNGRSAARGMAVPWPEAGPRIEWDCEMGEGYCAPAVALGRLLAFDRLGGHVRLRCLHAGTGKKLWEERYPTGYADMFGYDGGPRAAPVVAGDRVITFGPEGRLECRSLADGSSVWRVDTAATYHVVQNFFGVGAAPLVVAVDGGPLVVVQVGGSRQGTTPPSPERLDLVKGLDSGLVAFDLATGRERWRCSDQLASYSAPVLATIGGRERILAWMRDDFLVVDPATGRLEARFRWRADDVFSAVCASPVAAGNEVLLSECYGPGSVLLDLAAAPPKPLRQDPARARPAKALKSHWATPVLHDGHVYGASGRHSGDAMLCCVEWKTGAVKWAEGGFGRASMALVDGHLIVLGEYGDLAVVRASPERYTEVSRARLVAGGDRRENLLAAPCWAAPVIARGRCYVRGQGRLVCLGLGCRPAAPRPDVAPPDSK